MSISRHAAYNLAGSIVPLAVSLAATPVYLGLIGEVRFGVLAVAWLLLGYFGLFELGLGRATSQHIASLPDSDGPGRARTFWTALALNVGLGVIGGLLIWPAATYFFGNFFKVDDALRPEMQAAVFWLVLAVPVATLSGVLSGALQGRGRFLELSLVSMVGTLLFQLLPLAAANLWGAHLGVILPAVLAARVLTLVMLFECCWRHVFRGQAVTFDRTQARQLLRFGGWVSVSAFVSPMMVILDRFVIGAISGAKAVTFYTIPFQLAERSTLIPGALSSALFPRFVAATRQEEQLLAHEGIRVLAVVMTPLMAVGILFMESFLSWWITPAFAERSALVGQVVLMGFWVNSFAFIPYAQLQARGHPELVAGCHLAEVLPYFGLLYLGLHTWGMIGAAWVFSIRVLVDLALLAALAGTLRMCVRVLWTPALLLAGGFLIATQCTPGQPVWLILVVADLLITVVWAWREAPDPVRKVAFARLEYFRHGT